MKRPASADAQSSAKAHKTKRTKKSDCIIPPPVSDSVMNQFTLGRNENEAKRIADHVEWQCAKDKG